uniref:Guanylate cyclase, other n=2 Tax=Tetraselmis sp. GSL018 TaxID=582737 RepID=A0A061S3Q4_9CHLO
MGSRPSSLSRAKPNCEAREACLDKKVHTKDYEQELKREDPIYQSESGYLPQPSTDHKSFLSRRSGELLQEACNVVDRRAFIPMIDASRGLLSSKRLLNTGAQSTTLSSDSLVKLQSARQVPDGKLVRPDKTACREDTVFALSPSLSSGQLVTEVVCVDDDPVQHILFRKALTGSFLVTSAYTVEEALRLLERKYEKRELDCTSTVLIVDYLLPESNGLQLVTEARRRYASCFLPILLLSSDGTDLISSSSFAAGADDFVRKPVSSQQLATRVKAQQLAKIRSSKVAREVRQSTTLLENMLPWHTINTLTSGQQLQYDDLGEVTVVFTDVMDYKNVVASVGTEQVLSLLHQLYLAFDELTDTYGIYKVETTGDCYMAVAGHTKDTSRNHARCALGMASAMLKAAVPFKLPDGSPLRIRVGVHTGPAYAGVIGRKAPRYCFFGDTVNTASRMQTTSFGNCVQVSNATHKRCMKEMTGESISHHLFVSLGSRHIKGKGTMQTWLVKTGDWQQALAEVRLANARQMLTGDESE